VIFVSRILGRYCATKVSEDLAPKNVVAETWEGISNQRDSNTNFEEAYFQDQGFPIGSVPNRWTKYRPGKLVAEGVT